MSEIKKNRHHYVPKFYLKNFTNNNKYICTFVVEKNKYIRNGSIRTMAQSHNLYGDTNEVEDKLCEIEMKASKIIKDIIQTKTLPTKLSLEFLQLMQFIVISDLRTLKLNEIVSEQQKRLKDSILSSINGDLDKLSNQVKEILRFDKKENSVLLLSMSSGLQYKLHDLEMCLISHNSRSREFITTDVPINKDNIFAKSLNGYSDGTGFSNLGFELFFPITPKLCLFLYDPKIYEITNSNSMNVKINDKDIDKINKYFYLNSNSNLYFSEKISEDYLKKHILSYEKHSKNKILEDSFRKHTNSKGQDSLYEFRLDSSQGKLILPFIKMTEYAKTITVKPSAGFYQRSSTLL
ncbi:DUF4238 domain-containing protein [Lactococcus lactis]|uniref:DUF4238 domain-containing protein n=1 Tax=Lactococcus lactis TaxID=1358 RepID=UPI00384C1128